MFRKGLVLLFAGIVIGGMVTTIILSEFPELSDKITTLVFVALAIIVGLALWLA